MVPVCVICYSCNFGGVIASGHSPANEVLRSEEIEIITFLESVSYFSVRN